MDVNVAWCDQNVYRSVPLSQLTSKEALTYLFLIGGLQYSQNMQVLVALGSVLDRDFHFLSNCL